MPIYVFQHPKTNETFEEFRTVKNRNKPFVAPDGAKCKRVVFPSQNIDPTKGHRASLAGQNLEVFQADPGYVKMMHPKFIKFNDNHLEKYDPNKHC